MIVRKRIQLILTNNQGKKTRINAPVFMEGIDPQILKSQIEDILGLGVLLDTKDYNRYLVTCVKAVKIEVRTIPIFKHETIQRWVDNKK